MARTIVLRPGRSRAAWQDEKDPLKTIATEFSVRGGVPDLEPSVYILEMEDEDPRALLVRVLSEHFACDLYVPPTPAFALDLSGRLPGVVREERQNARFSLTRSAHHYLRFSSTEDLARFVEEIRPEFSARAFDTTKDEILDYAKARLAEGNREWTEACADGNPASNWVKLIRKRDERAQREKEEAERKKSEEDRLAAKKAKGMKNWQEKHTRLERERAAPHPQQSPSLVSEQEPPTPASEVQDTDAQPPPEQKK